MKITQHKHNHITERYTTKVIGDTDISPFKRLAGSIQTSCSMSSGKGRVSVEGGYAPFDPNEDVRVSFKLDMSEEECKTLIVKLQERLVSIEKISIDT